MAARAAGQNPPKGQACLKSSDYNLRNLGKVSQMVKAAVVLTGLVT